MINITSHYYYNYDQLQASLIDYPYSCLPGLFTDSEKVPCKLFFNKVGVYYSSARMAPCLWIPDVGTIPPDFLAGFDFTYKSVAFDIYGVPHYTDFWVGSDGQEEVFQYWTDSNTGFDIQLVDGGSIIWNFAEFHVAPQNAKIFDVPKNAPVCNFTSSVDASRYFLFNRFAAKHSEYTSTKINIA